MITYQDFLERKESPNNFIAWAISQHTTSDEYKMALSADEYSAERNETILNFMKMVYRLNGDQIEDFTASNIKIASNFFKRLNTQRNTYSLGNGVSFTDNKEVIENEDGTETTIDHTKEKLGKKFDTKLKELGYNALIHGVSFGFWDVDKLYVFKLTEFIPCWDEENGTLRAGVRFWQIDENKPIIAVLYEEDGYTKYKKSKDSKDFVEVEPKRKYIEIKTVSPEGGEELVEGQNYPSFPIIPLWGTPEHQSTLVGMRAKIDAFDLVRSGFANDLNDCAEVYWLINNANGATDEELGRFRDRLKFTHIAVTDDESSVTPYTQNIPYDARSAFLAEIRSGIYEDFGGLDVHTISAGATNDHIDAGYQPMDENADDFEFQVSEFIDGLLNLLGIEDTPIFKRNRISNQKEQTDMVLSASEYLDTETILQKLPFITVDEVSNIMAKKDQENADRMEEDESMMEEEEMDGEEDDEPDDIDAQLEALMKELGADGEEE